MTVVQPETLDLTDCDREPIHIPEAIQLHGLLFVFKDGQVVREAGRLTTITGRETWLGHTVDVVLGSGVAERLRRTPEGFVGRWRGANGLDYDVVARPNAQGLIVEVEQSSQGAQPGVELISRLDAAGARLERAPTVRAVCERAAEAFRDLIGFDRIMIYRFLDDGAGQVIAESRSDEVES